MEDDKTNRMQKNDTKASVVRKFNVAFRELERETDKRIQHIGIFRGQQRILIALSRQSDISQVMLAKRLNISTATVTTMLKKLEIGGFIQRTNHDKDARTKKVFLTEKGILAVSESRSIFRQIEAVAFENFSDEEELMLISLLVKFAENLKKARQDADNKMQ